MKLQKIEVGTNNLKKYIFLFIKGHLNNGDLMGEADDKLEDIINEIEHLFVTSKYEVISFNYLLLYILLYYI